MWSLNEVIASFLVGGVMGVCSGVWICICIISRRKEKIPEAVAVAVATMSAQEFVKKYLGLSAVRLNVIDPNFSVSWQRVNPDMGCSREGVLTFPLSAHHPSRNAKLILEALRECAELEAIPALVEWPENNDGESDIPSPGLSLSDSFPIPPQDSEGGEGK